MWGEAACNWFCTQDGPVSQEKQLSKRPLRPAIVGKYEAVLYAFMGNSHSIGNQHAI